MQLSDAFVQFAGLISCNALRILECDWIGEASPER
jgi:hypothetical protein